MLKSTEQHKKFWRERKINWDADYFTTWQHPHRMMLIQYLKKIRFDTLLELGCASGPNLYLIQKHFPQAKLGGIDISEDAITCAQQKLRPDTMLEARSLEDIFLSDKSVDAILADMTLIYMGPQAIHRALKEITRVCRTHLILFEFHSKNPLARLGLRFASGYNAYNYESLLQRYGFFDIEVTKIPESLWPGGEPQKTFGYFITAKI